jgi:hypothetical protein
MKKILNETQRRTVQFLSDRANEERNGWHETQLRSVLASVDEAEKRLAELEPPDLRTEELTFKVTYDANIVSPKEVPEEIKKALKELPFTKIDLILPSSANISSPGEGFRRLKFGEVIQEGDQWMNCDGEWGDTNDAGRSVCGLFYRRRINETIPKKCPECNNDTQSTNLDDLLVVGCTKCSWGKSIKGD